MTSHLGSLNSDKIEMRLIIFVSFVIYSTHLLASLIPSISM